VLARTLKGMKDSMAAPRRGRRPTFVRLRPTPELAGRMISSPWPCRSSSTTSTSTAGPRSLAEMDEGRGLNGPAGFLLRQEALTSKTAVKNLLQTQPSSSLNARFVPPPLQPECVQMVMGSLCLFRYFFLVARAMGARGPFGISGLHHFRPA